MLYNAKIKSIINAAAGRPRENILQPGLLDGVVELSLRGAAAHERRRADVTLNSCLHSMVCVVVT